VIEPLRMSLMVSCDATHAFETWTMRASSWWPRDHTASQESSLEVVFEPRVGGRIFERTSSGREIEWGEITIWEPPRRLGYLWHLVADRSAATDVQIGFVPVTDSSTRVEIEHGGWDRLGSEHRSQRRDANVSGWASLLPMFAAACDQRSACPVSIEIDH
jgi:Activator of Hsp90 ATPase homolog 1-like protein